MGFFGGFYHCSSMCGPLVVSQVHNSLSKIPVNNYSNFKKISIIALLPYHLGRITTYCLTAVFICFLRINFDKALGFNNYLASFLIFIAIILFIKIFFSFNNIKITKIFISKSFNLNFFTKYPKKIFNNFFKIILKKTEFLMNNSAGFKGYLLGLILGFLPCGMLFQAYSVVANFSNIYLAFIGMFLFGILTIPALFIVGYFGRSLIKLPEFKIIANIVIIFNIYNLTNIFIKNFI